MSSGILRISFSTTPDSLTRSSSFSSFAANAGSSKVQVRSTSNRVFIKSSDRSVNNYAAMNLKDRATNDDSPNLILVVVVRTAFVHISPAAVFLGLARR